MVSCQLLVSMASCSLISPCHKRQIPQNPERARPGILPPLELVMVTTRVETSAVNWNRLWTRLARYAFSGATGP
jgi:hypothetical protein